jgi:hypothetical protein
MHWEGNICLCSLPDDNGRPCVGNVSYWSAYRSGQLISMGRHEDVLVHESESGEWKFKRRVVLHSWSTTDPPEATPPPRTSFWGSVRES